MKRLLVVVAIVAAGCASEKAVDTSPEPRGLTLAYFTGVVDPAARTVTLRSEPTLAAQVIRAGPLVIPSPGEVTVTSSGEWFDLTPTDRGCGEIPTWGAEVTVTSQLDPTWLSGVYAEITDMGGVTGDEACNPVPAPAGMSNDYGLWSYGALKPWAPDVTQTWIFNLTTTASFTFHGRIVAAKVDDLSVASPPSGLAIATIDGDVVYYGAGTSDFRLFRVNSSGTLVATSARALPDTALSIATTPAKWFWYVTGAADGKNHVGYFDANLTGGADVRLTDFGSNTDIQIVADPGNSDRAWFVTSASQYLGWIAAGSPPSVQSYYLWMGRPSGLAIGPGFEAALSTIYVTFPDDKLISMHLSSDPSTWGAVGTVTVPGCEGPNQIVLGPDGNMYYVTSDSRYICKVDTTTSDASKVSTTLAAWLCPGVDGAVWYVAASPTDALGRFTPVANPTVESEIWEILTPGTPHQCASGGGYMWAVDSTNSLLMRVQP